MMATPGSENTTVKITIKHGYPGLFGGAALNSSLVRVDESHSNPKARWKAMGSPKYMSESQIKDLRSASELSPEETVSVRWLNTETSEVSFDLPAFSVVRVLISAKQPTHPDQAEQSLAEFV